MTLPKALFSFSQVFSAPGHVSSSSYKPKFCSCVLFSSVTLTLSLYDYCCFSGFSYCLRKHSIFFLCPPSSENFSEFYNEIVFSESPELSLLSILLTSQRIPGTGCSTSQVQQSPAPLECYCVHKSSFSFVSISKSPKHF